MDTGFIELKGLSRYRFRIADGDLTVTQVRYRKQILKGESRLDGDVYHYLKGDDGRQRKYSEKQIKFFVKNPDIPALCTIFKRAGIYLSDDGELISKPKQRRRYDVFKDINDALETVLLIKAYQEGDVGPILVWLRDARENAVRSVIKFGHYSYEKAHNCLDAAEERFLHQLENVNIMRIMPLFAMFCKCLKVEIMESALPYKSS